MSTHDRVLVIDDSSMSRALLSRLLSDAGYVVDLADGGARGIELATQSRPDVVLLDIMMPEIDGYETCRRMRCDPKLAQSKIIIVSGKNQVSERLSAYEAGADDYVARPFDCEELLAKVHVYTRLKSLEEIERVKDSVIEVLQHTTRTPLTNILSYAELLRVDTEMDRQTRHEFADVIQGNADRLQRLLEKAEVLVRMKSGRFSFEFEALDLYHVVQDEVDDARIDAGERRIAITAIMAQEFWCNGDTQQLRFVLRTVLNNAVRFSPDGGKVVVSIRRDGGVWQLRVSDSGPGIPPSLMPRLFDALSDTDSPLHNAGDGLSLCICREITTAHNGSICAESDPSSGVTITVELPALSARMSKTAFVSEGSAQQGQGESPCRPATSCTSGYLL